MSLDDILEVVSRSDELYRGRAAPGAVRESIALLTGSPGGVEIYEVQWRLSRSLFFLGQEADSRAARRQLHAAAVGAGERACAINSERVEGHFWLGVNLALFAEASGGLSGIRAVLRARRELQTAAAISEIYHAAGPLRVLGRLEHKAPWFAGGNLKRSRAYFDRALAIEPANSVTLLFAAELAVDSGDHNRATTLLERIIRLSVDPEWEFENRRDQDLALSLLASLSGD